MRRQGIRSGQLRCRESKEEVERANGSKMRERMRQAPAWSESRRTAKRGHERKGERCDGKDRMVADGCGG